MSHVATIEVEIKDLEALRTAAKDLGMEFREGQTTCRRNRLVIGPLPEGFTAKEMGTCEHAITLGDIAIDNPRSGIPHPTAPYEIGICKRRDGKPGYVLMWDDFCGGFGLMDAVGPKAQKLVQRYAVNVAKREAKRQGYAVLESMRADGTVEIQAVKKPGR